MLNRLSDQGNALSGFLVVAIALGAQASCPPSRDDAAESRMSEAKFTDSEDTFDCENWECNDDEPLPIEEGIDRSEPGEA